MKNIGAIAGGIVKLKGAYPTWNVNEKDRNVLTAWFDVMDFASDERFIEMVNVYARTRKYPPQSPRDLYEAYLEEEKSKHISGEIIWENAMNGFALFGGINRDYIDYIAHDLKTDKDAMRFATSREMASLLSAWQNSESEFTENSLKARCQVGWDKAIDNGLKLRLREESEKALENKTNKLIGE